MLNTKLLTTLLIALATTLVAHAQNYHWAHGFGGPNYDSQGTSIATDAQGNVYVTGTFGDSIDFDPGVGIAILGVPPMDAGIFVAKFDSAGIFKWAFSLNGYSSYGTPHLAVNATGLYVTSCFYGTVDFDPSAATATLTANNTDIVLAKYDLSGNYVWAINMGGNSTDVANSIAVDNIGNSYITGYFKDTADFDPTVGMVNLISDTLVDTFFGKYDFNGNLIWVHDLCDTNGAASGGRVIALDKNSNDIYISGTFSGTIDFDRGGGIYNVTDTNQTSTYIAKYETSGSFIWAGNFNGATFVSVLDIYVNDIVSNDFYICGSFSGVADFDLSAGVFSVIPNNNYAVIYFAKYTSTGSLIWIKQTTKTGNLGLGRSITTDNNGNVYLTGDYNGTTDFDPGSGITNLTTNGLRDIFFAKYDSLGNYIWAEAIGGFYDDQPISIALDPASSIYIAGYFTNSMDADPGSGNVTLYPAQSENIFIGKYSNNLTSLINWQTDKASSIVVFPNPVNEIITVFKKEKLLPVQTKIIITNAMGEIVYQEFTSSSQRHSTINVKFLPSGIYCVTSISNTTLMSAKFIKN